VHLFDCEEMNHQQKDAHKTKTEKFFKF
jgi:hypothetical protein